MVTVYFGKSMSLVAACFDYGHPSPDRTRAVYVVSSRKVRATSLAT
jgi:hypothetical protein